MNSPLPELHTGWEENEVLVESGDQFLRGVDPSFGRLLTEQRRSTDGTLAVLMIVFALFCFIWAPVMMRRCRAQNQNEDDAHDLARFEAEARAVRATLQRMSMVRNSFMGDGMNDRYDPNLQHRKEFLDNALLTKKVIFQSKLADDDIDRKQEVDDVVKEDSGDSSESRDRKPLKRQKSNVIVLVNTTTCKKESTSTPKAETPSSETDESPQESKESESTQKKTNPQSSPISPQSTKGDESQLEPCSICLVEYDDGDEICWSHNENCNHFFHKTCIQTWLLTHEECPCCRQDFLCLWGDEDDNGTQSLRHTHTRSDQSTSASSLDWAEELAEEIQQRILQRQRQLQAELYRRDRQQQQRLRSASFPVRTEPGLAARNTVISVDDMAAGFLLYRHFPMQFASDPRRLALSSLEQERNEDNDDDVEVAHFGLQLHSPSQSYRPDQPIVVAAPGMSLFEIVDRSSRRRHLSPGDHQPAPFFSSAALDTSRRFFARDTPRSPSTSPSGNPAEILSTQETSAIPVDENDDDVEIVTASA